ncbi:hypothetical protein KSL88_20705 [Pectobacterium polaris]|uniref:hypothetical protein n=1 Tax=Pectobacterium polaris TaxID=2042057 RepID=UPI001CC5FACE|nr:hypothetical protein [Pectobacterium polaris]UAY91862.1 hypothetical protein KSL88_20705 [Pectobacterium polaris]
MVILNWLNLGWVGSTIGITGILSAIFFYFKSNKKGEPYYQWQTNTIIGEIQDDISSDIKISFKGIDIDSLKRTIIVLWNNGNSYIDNNIIIKEYPLTISFPDGDILSHQVKSVSKSSIIASTHKKDGNICVDFNYLDSKEGVCVEILHTSSEYTPSVSCTIKGIKGGFINKGKIPQQDLLKKGRILKYLMPTIGILMTSTGVISIYIKDLKDSGIINSLTKADTWMNSIGSEYSIIGWAVITLGILYTATPFALDFVYKNKIPKSIDIN